MPNTFAQIPYGTSATGISVQYGDAVPDGAVNLAYVQTKVPAAPDVVDIEDDLSDGAKYAGNTIAARVRALLFSNGQVIDPNTGNLWTAPTDNVLFTTVTAALTDATGATTAVPLFFRQKLRFGIPLTSLPTELANYALLNGVSALDSTFSGQNYRGLSALIGIAPDAGGALPSGYLYSVLPERVDAGLLYVSVYTNFQSSFGQRFVVSWASHSETLNARPVYFQHRTTVGKRVYLARPVIDNSVGALNRSTAIPAGSSTASIVAGGGTGVATQPRSAPVSNVSAPYITSVSSSAPTSSTIALTTENPFYVNGPAGFVVYPAAPITYQTGGTMSAPVDNSTELSLQFTNVTPQVDANGAGQVLVTLYDPNGIPVKTFDPISAPTTLTYSAPGALAGVYTWSVRATVNDFLGIQNNVAQGQYAYSVSWAGVLGWYIPTSTTYTDNTSQPINYSTPANTVAPVGSSSALSLNLSAVTVPSDPYGTSSYTITLTDPAGVLKHTWSGLVAAQTLSWPLSGATDPGALPGSYVWSITAVSANNGTSTSRYQCSLSGTQTWNVSVPATSTIYNNADGVKVGYASSNLTLAPTNPNCALTLVLSNVAVQNDANGNSSLKIDLIDPSGQIVKSWSHITSPQSFSYSNLAAQAGVWTWNIYASCSNTGLALSTYTCTWVGTYGWLERDPAATSAAAQRTIGFTFAVGTSDGTVYATTDDGPQVFVQEPDNLSPAENWYLRLHRGWLSYADPAGTTYLVGVEPYYQQNFDGLIPVVTAHRQQAQAQSTTSVRVTNTPLLVEPEHPIDVIVTRRGISGPADIWLTRAGGVSSGAYLPEALSDVDAARGLLTLSNFYLQSNDTVHVSYSYLEYYLVYRGFPDAFGRFVHLDVNPSGGHTWMNLWNITSAIASRRVADTGVPVITTATNNVATLVSHSGAVNAAGTATITSGTQSSTANVRFSAGVVDAQSMTIAAASSTGVNSISTPVSDTSTGSVTTQQQTTLAPGPKTRGERFTGTIDLLGVATSSAQNTTGNGATATNTSTAKITSSSTSSVSRVSTGWQNWNTYVSIVQSVVSGGYRHIWTYDPAALQIFPFQVDQLPVDPASAIVVQLRNMSSNAAFPWNAMDHQNGRPIDGFGGNLPGPIFDLFCGLESPGNSGSPSGYIFSEHTIAALGDISFTEYDSTLAQYIAASPQMVYIGQYKLAIYPTAINGSTSWDDDQNLGNLNLTVSGQYNISSLQNSNSVHYDYTQGQVSSYATDAGTKAPVDAGSQLSLTLSSVVVPSDSAGTSSYNLTLMAPNGAVVLQQANITAGQTFNYSSPNALPGVYTWSLWSSVTGHQAGSGTYACSATVAYSWIELSSSYSYGTQTSNPTTKLFPIGAALAPVNSGTQLSLVIGAGTFQSDSFGNAAAYITLTDPNGKLCAITAGGTTAQSATLSAPGTVTYSEASAQPGVYTWSVVSAYVETNSTGHGQATYALPFHKKTLSIDVPVTLNWEETVSSTTYVYQAQDGIPVQYALDAGTVAPVDVPNQLGLTLSAVSCPSDAYGSSSLTVQLLNPAGQVVANFPNITTPTPLTYHQAGAPSGQYTWVLTAKVTGTNLGPSSYRCSFTGTLTSKDQKTTTSYPTVAGTPVTTSTPASTVAPTSSATQLTLNLSQVQLGTSGIGAAQLAVTLTRPDATVVSMLAATSLSVPQLLNYSAAGAPAGVYTWTISVSAVPTGVGPGSLAVNISGKSSWYQSVTASSTVYTEADGATQSFPMTASASPDGSDPKKAIALKITALTAPSNANGAGALRVWLTDPSSTIVATWTVNHLDMLSYSAPSAPTGTWNWNVAATASNANTGTGSYACSLTGTMSWPQTNTIPVTTYTPTPGAFKNYLTSAFTTAPLDANSQISFKLTSLSAPSDRAGTVRLAVQLLTPASGLVHTWSSVKVGDVLTYSAVDAVSGAWQWKVIPVVDPTNTGSGSYITQWGAQLSWYEAIDDEVATVELVDRALYLYLTVDGYPFHAVLDPLDDPTQPIAHDTNHALAGTRYASMPTIHAF